MSVPHNIVMALNNIMNMVVRVYGTSKKNVNLVVLFYVKANGLPLQDKYTIQ
jgi:hypothetical protein